MSDLKSAAENAARLAIVLVGQGGRIELSFPPNAPRTADGGIACSFAVVLNHNGQEMESTATYMTPAGQQVTAETQVEPGAEILVGKRTTASAA